MQDMMSLIRCPRHDVLNEHVAVLCHVYVDEKGMRLKFCSRQCLCVMVVVSSFTRSANFDVANEQS